MLPFLVHASLPGIADEELVVGVFHKFIGSTAYFVGKFILLHGFNKRFFQFTFRFWG
jgi:hypothetical protein